MGEGDVQDLRFEACVGWTDEGVDRLGLHVLGVSVHSMGLFVSFDNVMALP